MTPSCRIEFSSSPQLPGSVPVLQRRAAAKGQGRAGVVQCTRQLFPAAHRARQAGRACRGGRPASSGAVPLAGAWVCFASAVARDRLQTQANTSRYPQSVGVDTQLQQAGHRPRLTPLLHFGAEGGSAATAQRLKLQLVSCFGRGPRPPMHGGCRRPWQIPELPTPPPGPPPAADRMHHNHPWSEWQCMCSMLPTAADSCRLRRASRRRILRGATPPTPPCAALPHLRQAARQVVVVQIQVLQLGPGVHLAPARGQGAVKPARGRRRQQGRRRWGRRERWYVPPCLPPGSNIGANSAGVFVY